MGVLLGHGKTSVSRKGRNHLSWGFYGELNVWVKGVDKLVKLSTMFYLLDDKGVIHIPKP